MIMQTGSPLAEKHIKNIHFTYTVGTFEGIGKQRTSIGKMSPTLPKCVRELI